MDRAEEPEASLSPGEPRESEDAEQALKQSDDQFRLLVQGVTDYAIFMLDPGGRVASWNAGAQRIKGYRPEEIIGRHFSRFYTEEDRANSEPQSALEIAARDGRFEKEGWRVRKDGTRFWANVVIDAIYDPQGNLSGFAKVTRDITERREAQRALETTREALIQSQKMEAIGQLTGGVAHDFNNLLTAILGSLELLRKRMPGEPKAMALLDNAVMAAQRGATLTQRMLAFARRRELELEPIDVPLLVRGMTGLLQQSLGPSITIETRFPLALSAVWTDGNQLEAALLNLMVNARDAMPEGGSIIVAAREETVTAVAGGVLPGRYVCLSVTDPGEGMDEKTLARATEPFFTTKGTGKGTGLGLSMVQGLTEQAGGRIVLKSKQGSGTTVELWLRVANLAEAALGRDRHAKREEPESAVRPLVVLAVDDDSLVLLNTRAMLEDLGHQVFEASSGLRALEILRQEKTIDLVITDQAMPQMTGLELVRAIRAEWPHMVIILATGFAELPPAADADLPKIAKPFRQYDIARQIAIVMQAKPKLPHAAEAPHRPNA